MTWIVPVECRIQTPFQYRPGDHRIEGIDLAVIHFPGSPGRKDTPHNENEARIGRYLEGANEDRKSAAHLVVSRAALAYQGASLNARVWHARGSVWRGEDGINYRSLALEPANVGPLVRESRRSGNELGHGRFVDWYGGTYHGPYPYEHKRDGRVTYWEPYRLAQMVTFLHLVTRVVAELPVLSDPDRWVGHSAIRPGKLDPGPAFPWQAVWDVLGGLSPGETDWADHPGVVDA